MRTMKKRGSKEGWENEFKLINYVMDSWLHEFDHLDQSISIYKQYQTDCFPDSDILFIADSFYNIAIWWKCISID